MNNITVTYTKDVTNCGECPAHTTERTIGAGYALDYLCTRLGGKTVVGYVEWDSELKKAGIPLECPLRVFKNEPMIDVGL